MTNSYKIYVDLSKTSFRFLDSGDLKSCLGTLATLYKRYFKFFYSCSDINFNAFMEEATRGLSKPSGRRHKGGCAAEEWGDGDHSATGGERGP